MTSKASFLLAIISGLFVAALIGHQQAFALLAIPLILLLAGGFLSFKQAEDIAVNRSVSSRRVKEGQTVEMKVGLRNHGSERVNLDIQEALPPGAHLREGTLRRKGTLPVGGHLEIKYVFTAGRGRYSWNKFHLVFTDLFGLFEKRVTVPTAAELIVLPERMSLRRVKLRPEHTMHTPGLNLSGRAGVGTDFFGVREFQKGDSIRWVDWHHSARIPGRIITKQFESEEAADIGILLDASQATLRPEDESDLFEHSVQAALSFAETFIAAGNRVSLIALGRRLIRVFPGSGKQHLMRIQDRLAGCRMSENANVESLRYLPVKLFPSHAMVIMISSLHSQDGLETAARLHRNGYQVVLLSPDPYKLDEGQTIDAVERLAVRTASLERAVLVWRIRRMGVEVVDWDIRQPLRSALQSGINVQRRRRMN